MCVKKKSTEYAEDWGGVQESHSLRSEAAVTNSNESFTQILIQQFERIENVRQSWISHNTFNAN